ncbi:hypothetical protein MY3296_009657 [Beauveria thailandica]
MLPIFFSLITLAWAIIPRRLECNNPHPSDELLTLHSNLADGKLFTRSNFPESVIIKTYVHIFAENTTYEGGWLSNTTIEKQINVLNRGFNSTPFRFALAGISRNVTRLPPATNPSMDAQMAFWFKYRQGNYRSLNLYYVSGFYGGQCTFPSMQAALESSADFFMDGCTMGADTTPGSGGLFGAGTTTIHEVGHWMGLLHTFHGGCSSEYGDFVADTPFESDAPSKIEQTFEVCPVGRDSCPDLPGLDPIHNYMDYTSEDCRSEFTIGQIDRMKSMWALVRNVRPSSG